MGRTVVAHRGSGRADDSRGGDVRRTGIFGVIGVVLAAAMVLPARADLPDTVDAIRASVVAVGTYQTTRRPPSVFRGTGFVVGDAS